MTQRDFEADATAQADALIQHVERRNSSIDSTSSSSTNGGAATPGSASNGSSTTNGHSTPADPSLAYKSSLFKHTNVQYLRVKEKMARQALRKARRSNADETAAMSGIAVHGLSKEASEASTTSSTF